MKNKTQSAKLTFDQFVEIAGRQAEKFQRRGQEMMCVLNDFSNQIYSAVVDFGPSDVDCFYSDANIPAFLKYLLVNHVALHAEPEPLALRPETVKVGQFYRTTNKDVMHDNPDVLFFGVQDLTFKTHLVIVSPNNELYHGKTVKPARDGDWSYWDSFYEVSAPNFKP